MLRDSGINTHKIRLVDLYFIFEFSGRNTVETHLSQHDCANSCALVDTGRGPPPAEIDDRLPVSD